MSKIPMISHAKHNYDDKLVMPGEPFDALNETDADDLKCIGFATRAPVAAAAAARPAGTYQTRVLVAEKPVAPQVTKPLTAAKPKAEPKKRVHKTRDMGSPQ